MQLANPTAAAPVERLAGRIDEISSLPDVAMRVIEVANDSAAGAQELKAVMEGDVSLSARVLRLVNSAAYGLRERVTNLQMAIAYLGFRQIRNLALTATISDLFKDDRPVGSYRRSALWRHLVGVGIASRMIAMRRRLDNFEDVFLAGLMHDVGIVFEDQYDHRRFEQAMAALESHRSLEEAEQACLGYTHTQLGALVGEKWRFPPVVVAAIAEHHGNTHDSKEHAAAVRCVEVANMLCSAKGMTSVGVNRVAPPVAAVNALQLTRPDLEALMADFEEEIVRHATLFTL